MSRVVEERIKTIETKAMTEIPAVIAQSKQQQGVAAISQEFKDARVDLNLLLIETVLGAEIKQGKKAGEMKIHYTKALPTIDELNRICRIMDTYTSTVETPYYAEVSTSKIVNAAAAGADIPEDMAIPPQSNNIVGNYKTIGMIEKVNKKSVKEELFDHSLVAQYLDSKSVLVLASYGEKIRKKQNITMTLIIAGVTVAIAGGVITGIYLYNKKQEDEVLCDENDDDIDDIDVDINDEVPIVEIA